MTCFDRQYIRRVTAIALDDCGRIAATPATGTVIKGLADTLQSVAFTRNVDVPQQTVTKKVNGGTCTQPFPTPTDRGFSTALTFCGIHPVFESITGYKRLDMNGSTITGWEDSNITGNPKVALEIIYESSADACTGGTVPCFAQIIPAIVQWVRSGDETYNGTDVPALVMTGQALLNGNLFDNYTSATLPPWLSHWAPKFNDIQTGRAWSTSAVITCPAADTHDSCVLTTIT
jgi:hypothetical protein